MGDSLNVLDVAWFIYAHRLSLGGYPFARLHPRVGMWMERLRDKPEFAKEIAMPPEAVKRLEATRRSQMEAGKTLEAVARFWACRLASSPIDCGAVGLLMALNPDVARPL